MCITGDISDQSPAIKEMHDLLAILVLPLAVWSSQRKKKNTVNGIIYDFQNIFSEGKELENTGTPQKPISRFLEKFWWWRKGTQP